jgi:hypothetical protein
MSDITIEAYPLHWPAGWPRTARPRRSNFRTKFGDARANVRRELALLGARGVVVSTNLPLKPNGDPYAPNSRRKLREGEERPEYAEPEDRGVAVYFTLNNETRCIPVDKWDKVGDNLHAVGLTINALRGLDRWGAKEMINAAFSGFAALPAETASPSWWSILGVAHDAPMAEIDAAFKRQSLQHHPDRGGDVALWHELNEAYRQGKGQRP